MRLRIKYPQLDMDSLSVQHVLDCNYYNQGCDGGYPSLVGKYGNELFFIEEKYKYYKGQGT
jgi:cathepsin C